MLSRNALERPCVRRSADSLGKGVSTPIEIAVFDRALVAVCIGEGDG